MVCNITCYIGLPVEKNKIFLRRRDTILQVVIDHDESTAELDIASLVIYLLVHHLIYMLII